MRRIITFLLLLASCASFAEVYVNQTKDGTEYTDTPSSNSQAVMVPPVNTITSTQPAIPATAPTTSLVPGNSVATSSGTETPPSTQNDTAYTTFEIVSPKPEENIQNQAVISVEFKVEPKLASSDKIQVMLDNKIVGTPSGMLYQEISNVERGTHTLAAMIVNSNNQTLKTTSAITIYVHRNSTITSPATAPRSSNEGQTSSPTLFESAEIASG